MLAAADLGSRAAKVGCVLWLRAGITKSKTVEYSLRQFAGMTGIDRSDVLKVLTRMENAGLVVIQRAPRRKLKVTILNMGTRPT